MQYSTSLSKLRKNIIKFVLLLCFLHKHYTSLEYSAKRKAVPCLIINLFVFRVDPAYMYYYIHWTRLLCTGIIPFSYLSYMNLRIYTRIRQTSLSTVRSRSSSSKKASNLAAVLIVIGESGSSHKVGGTLYLISNKKSMAIIRKILRKKVQILLRNNHFEYLYSISFSPDILCR